MVTQTVPVDYDKTNQALLMLEALMEGIKGMSGEQSNEGLLAQVAINVVNEIAISLHDAKEAAAGEVSHG